MGIKYQIEVVGTDKQVPYEGRPHERLAVMQELANRFNSKVKMWEIIPCDDNNGCVDFETQIIHEVKPNV